MQDAKTFFATKLASPAGFVQNFVKKIGESGFERLERNISLIVIVSGLGYIVATVISGLLMSTLMTGILASRASLNSKSSGQNESTTIVMSSSKIREATKAIKDRNLFSSEGKFPEENFGDQKKTAAGVFDIEAPCKPTTLPIELLGTIFLGDRLKSIATVRDKTYSEADVYRVGDEIYGSEGALVAAVDRQILIINNAGSKECIELNKPLPNQASDGFPSFGAQDFGSAQGGSSEIVLESSYVESELGPGFAKIMDAARFVPNTVEGQVNGFKLFAIRSGSIISKIGLQNNDVVTQVNDTSLKQAEQGFAFYQALQDEKEVRIQVLRGAMPVNINVRIK
ncbi:MAG: hypothetical protein NT027_15735 [Proteobacteria bacterium]|nr:hypothetical protein [Pseudomonadota bacterium]